MAGLIKSLPALATIELNNGLSSEEEIHVSGTKKGGVFALSVCGIGSPW